MSKASRTAEHSVSLVDPFPHGEFTNRWGSLQRAMKKAALDALLATSRSNFEYITGYRTPSWLIKSRPLMVILPVEGDPTVVVSSTHALDVAGAGIVRDIREFGGFERAATESLIATLRDKGLASARLGIESGQEQRLGMPLEEFRRLENECPKAVMSDAGQVFWEARIRKSELEIGRARTAGKIAGRVYESLMSDLGPGWSEAQVYRQIVAGTVELGGEAPGYVTMTGGPSAYGQHNTWPGQRSFEPGELFWVDVAGTFGGYYSDYTRCAAVGHASQEQHEAYALVLEMLDAALSVIKSGARVSSIFEAARSAAARKGASLRVASRIGHGVGLDLTEPPSLTSQEDSVLEASMILAVEPGMLTAHGWYHLEENVAVTDGGYELLSAPQPRELLVARGKPQ